MHLSIFTIISTLALFISISIAQNPPIQLGRNVPHRSLSGAGTPHRNVSINYRMERLEGRRRMNAYLMKRAIPTSSSQITPSVSDFPQPWTAGAVLPTSSATSSASPSSIPAPATADISSYFVKDSPYYVAAIAVCVAIAILISLLFIAIAKWCAHRECFSNDKDYPAGFSSNGTPIRESFTGLRDPRGMMRLGSHDFLNEKYQKADRFTEKPAKTISRIDSDKKRKLEKAQPSTPPLPSSVTVSATTPNRSSPSRPTISLPAPIFDPRPSNRIAASDYIYQSSSSHTTPPPQVRSATPPRLAYSKSHSFLRPISSDSINEPTAIRRSYTMKQQLSYPTPLSSLQNVTKNVISPRLLPPIHLKTGAGVNNIDLIYKAKDPFRNPSPHIPHIPYSKVGPIQASLRYNSAPSVQVGQVMIIPLRETRARSSNTMKVSNSNEDGTVQLRGALRYSQSLM